MLGGRDGNDKVPFKWSILDTRGKKLADGFNKFPVEDTLEDAFIERATNKGLLVGYKLCKILVGSQDYSRPTAETEALMKFTDLKEFGYRVVEFIIEKDEPPPPTTPAPAINPLSQLVSRTASDTVPLSQAYSPVSGRHVANKRERGSGNVSSSKETPADKENIQNKDSTDSEEEESRPKKRNHTQINFSPKRQHSPSLQTERGSEATSEASIPLEPDYDMADDDNEMTELGAETEFESANNPTANNDESERDLITFSNLPSESTAFDVSTVGEDPTTTNKKNNDESTPLPQQPPCPQAKTNLSDKTEVLASECDVDNSTSKASSSVCKESGSAYAAIIPAGLLAAAPELNKEFERRWYSNYGEADASHILATSTPNTPSKRFDDVRRPEIHEKVGALQISNRRNDSVEGVESINQADTGLVDEVDETPAARRSPKGKERDYDCIDPDYEDFRSDGSNSDGEYIAQRSAERPSDNAIDRSCRSGNWTSPSHASGPSKVDKESCEQLAESKLLVHAIQFSANMKIAQPPSNQKVVRRDMCKTPTIPSRGFFVINVRFNLQAKQACNIINSEITKESRKHRYHAQIAMG
ncbi:hypothetical protein BDR26DRAFT_1008107, partial [Obelidium mucronatum]